MALDAALRQTWSIDEKDIFDPIAERHDARSLEVDPVLPEYPGNRIKQSGPIIGHDREQVMAPPVVRTQFNPRADRKGA